MLKDNDRENGAEVRNARSCFSSEAADDEWCDIDVDELNASGGYSEVVSRIRISFATGTGPEAVLNEVFSSYLNLQLDLTNPTLSREQVDSLLSFAESALFNSAEALSACVENYFEFTERGDVPTELFEGEGLSCFVSGDVGWLHISLEGNVGVLTFHIAPPV